MALWAAGGLGGLMAARVVARDLVGRWQRAGRLVMNIAVVGNGMTAARVVSRITETGKGDARVIGVFEHIRHGAPGSPRMGLDLEDLVRLAREIPIDEIILALPLGGRA